MSHMNNVSSVTPEFGTRLKEKSQDTKKLSKPSRTAHSSRHVMYTKHFSWQNYATRNDEIQFI
jgi:hypothetical protein